MDRVRRWSKDTRGQENGRDYHDVSESSLHIVSSSQRLLNPQDQFAVAVGHQGKYGHPPCTSQGEARRVQLVRHTVTARDRSQDNLDPDEERPPPLWEMTAHFGILPPPN